ncbi:MAG: TetR/AcrR family transcriptional regulator [Acidobacteriota bacterium]
MADRSTQNRKTRTRDDFLDAAALLFAERGYYGASLADVAAELAVSKQAVLHRFASKERLYGEVLQRTAEHLERHFDEVTQVEDSAEEQLLAFLLAVGSSEPGSSTRLLMRELLDNAPRAERAGTWYLKSFLEGLIERVRTVPGWEKASRPRALALAYQLLGAVNYHSISHATLKAIFGERTYRSLEREFPKQLEATVRAALRSPP